MELVINGRFLSQRTTGVQRVAHEFTRALDRLLDEGRYPDTSVRLVAQADAMPPPLAHVRVERVGYTRGNIWEQIELPRHVGDAVLLCLGNSAPLTSLMSRRRVGVMLHDQAHLLFPDDYSLGYRMWHRVLDTAILAHARPLFTVSDTERDVIAARNPHARVAVAAPNGSWLDDAPVASALRGPGGYGLYVGSFTARKNVAALFTVARALANERGTAFRFVGPPSALSNAFRDSLTEAEAAVIRFPGFVSNDALAALYRDAACLLYPSFYEASGLPPAEAMTFGCPVIVSDLPVLRERCGDAALYCDPNMPGSVAAAMRRILDEPGLGATLSDRGRARAATFTWRAQAMCIMDALFAS